MWISVLCSVSQKKFNFTGARIKEIAYQINQKLQDFLLLWFLKWSFGVASIKSTLVFLKLVILNSLKHEGLIVVSHDFTSSYIQYHKRKHLAIWQSLCLFVSLNHSLWLHLYRSAEFVILKKTEFTNGHQSKLTVALSLSSISLNGKSGWDLC